MKFTKKAKMPMPFTNKSRQMCSVGVCRQYQFLLSVSVFWPRKQQVLLLSQQLSSCNLWEISQGTLHAFKCSPLHIKAHILNHIHHILWLLIHHLHQQPSEVFIAGTLQNSVSQVFLNVSLFEYKKSVK